MSKSIIPQLLELMPNTITMRRFLGSNNYGEPSWSTVATSFRARVHSHPEIHRTMTGETIEITHVVWFTSTSAWTPKDRMTLPDGTTPKIHLCEDTPDENGTHHNKFSIGY